MDSSWLSNASAGVVDYLYKQLTGGDETSRHSDAREVVSKEVWITDLPTNSYEPLELPHVARVMASKHGREANLEEKIATLKKQCNDKTKEICLLKDKLVDLQLDKENTRAQQLDERETRIHKLKKLCLVAKGQFHKKNLEAEQMKTDLKSTKEQLAEIDTINCSLKDQVKELKESLNAKTVTILEEKQETDKKNQEQSQRIVQLEKVVEKTHTKFTATSLEIIQLTSQLRSCQEQARELGKLNGSLKNHVTDLQKLLEDRDGTCRNQTSQICELKSLVEAGNVTLELRTNQINQLKCELRTSKEQACELETVNSSLNNVTELQRLVAQRNDWCEQQSLEILELKKLANTCNDELERKTKEVSRMREEMKTFDEQASEHIKRNCFLAKHVTDLKKLLDEKNSTCQERLKTIGELKVLVEIANETSTIATTTAYQMTTEIKSLKGKVEEKEAMLQRSSLQINGLRKLIDTSNMEIEKATVRMDKIRAEVDLTKAEEKPMVDCMKTTKFHKDLQFPMFHFNITNEMAGYDANKMKTTPMVIDMEQITEEREGMQGFLCPQFLGWFGLKSVSSPIRDV